MSGADYVRRLQTTLEKVRTVLAAKGIDPRHTAFGGEGELPTRKPIVPIDARSEFLANRAMGDWAERMLSSALLIAFPNWDVKQYGDTGRIAAGHVDFRESYIAGLEGTRRYGKRPDLLLFDSPLRTDDDLSLHGDSKIDKIVKSATAAIEVRSSKFEALTYMAVRQRQRDAGNKSSREAPSFTVKVEDLVSVYRWLERYGVPQSYCQVFFDSVFGINFLDIFAIVASGAGFLMRPQRRVRRKRRS